VIRAWSWWVERCTSTEVGTSLALFRIALGAMLLNESLGFHVMGALDPLYTSAAFGGMAEVGDGNGLVGLLGGPSQALTTGLFAASTAGAAALLVGLGGRWTAFFLLQTLLALYSLAPELGAGYERFTTNGLWLLVLGNPTATLSVDCRLATGGWSSNRLVYALPRYLGIYQVVVLYTATGLAKDGAAWYWPFPVLYHSFNRIPYVRWEPGWAGDIYPLLQLGTVVAWWWEALFFLVGLWFLAVHGWLGERASSWAARWDLRVPFLGMGLLTHMTLWVILDVGPFTMVTLAFYLTFYSPAEWAAVWKDGCAVATALPASSRRSRAPTVGPPAPSARASPTARAPSGLSDRTG
jgi:hypothetical protein